MGDEKQKERRGKWKEPVVDIATQLVSTLVCAECCITICNLRDSEITKGKNEKSMGRVVNSGDEPLYTA